MARLPFHLFLLACFQPQYSSLAFLFQYQPNTKRQHRLFKNHNRLDHTALFEGGDPTGSTKSPHLVKRMRTKARKVTGVSFSDTRYRIRTKARKVTGLSLSETLEQMMQRLRGSHSNALLLGQEAEHLREENKEHTNGESNKYHHGFASSQQVLSHDTDIDVQSSSGKAASPNFSSSSASMMNYNKSATKEKVNPRGGRWAVAHHNTDLSGDWSLIVDEKFKMEYDEYLAGLGQPALVRSVALSLIHFTDEIIKQSEDRLYIKGINPRGVWERTLISSGATVDVSDYKQKEVPVLTADSETVIAEAWWEEEGTKHISWLRGGKKYGGGDFESCRFLEKKDLDRQHDDSTNAIYVCESTFHPADESREKLKMTWRFERK